MSKFVGKRLAIGAAVLMGLIGMVGIGTGVSVAAPVHAAPAGVVVTAKTPSAAPQNLLGVGVTTNGVNMRACASTSCAVTGTGSGQSSVTVQVERSCLGGRPIRAWGRCR